MDEASVGQANLKVQEIAGYPGDLHMFDNAEGNAEHDATEDRQNDQSDA